MPTRKPQMSFEFLRNYIEKWQWRDPRTGAHIIGYNPPVGATEKAHVPFHIKFVTLKGEYVEGHCVCLKTFPRRRQHMIMFTESGEIRIINDYLVIEVDGTRFYA